MKYSILLIGTLILASCSTSTEQESIVTTSTDNGSIQIDTVQEASQTGTTNNTNTLTGKFK